MLPSQRVATLLALLLVAATLLGPPAAESGAALQLESVASDFSNPVFVTHAGDDSGRLFVVEQPGRIKIVEGSTVRSRAFLDIDDLVEDGGSEQGLLGLAFHPTKPRRVFVAYTAAAGSEWKNVVARYTVSKKNPNRLAPSSAKVVLEIDDEATNHNGGMLAFGRDGYLYLGTGDGGGSGDPDNNAQDRDELLGKLLRLDVDSLPYTVPSDNPFVGQSNRRGEIWAYGLRNPWRFSFDRSNGDLYVADVGQGDYEEINHQPASSDGGENYGWDIREGKHCFEATTCSTAGLTDPVFEYTHDNGNCSVTGGYVYRGPSAPSLVGDYVYGDYCTGRIWTLRGSDAAWSSRLLMDTSLRISSFGEDQDGELYVVDRAGGAIYRLVESGAQRAGSDDDPRRSRRRDRN